MCAERAVGGDPFAVLLADDFLTDCEPGITADLVRAHARSGKSQLSVMEAVCPLDTLITFTRYTLETTFAYQCRHWE